MADNFLSFEQLERMMKQQGFTKLALVFIDSRYPGEYKWYFRWLVGTDEKEIQATCERFKIDRKVSEQQTSERKMLGGGYLIQ